MTYIICDEEGVQYGGEFDTYREAFDKYYENDDIPVECEVIKKEVFAPKYIIVDYEGVQYGGEFVNEEDAWDVYYLNMYIPVECEVVLTVA